MPMYRRVNKNFFKTWSPEMAYVLGFFAADGNMIKGPRGNHYISFHSTDRCLLLQVKKAMESDHKLAIHKREETDRTKNWKTSYQIQVGSKEIFNDLVNLGMTPNKSNNLSFPDMPRKYMSDFVRGYFDGDGCIYFKKHYARDRDKKRWVFSSRFISGSVKFLECLHKKLSPLSRKGLC